MTAKDNKTVEDIRKEAELEYEEGAPRPVPPVPPTLARPSVVRVSAGAHLWIDVASEGAGYNRRGRAYAQFFLIEREHGRDQRVEGELTSENVDALIQELTRIRQEVSTKQTFLDMTADFEKQYGNWEKARTEFARRRVAEWERAKGAKK